MGCCRPPKPNGVISKTLLPAPLLRNLLPLPLLFSLLMLPCGRFRCLQAPMVPPPNRPDRWSQLPSDLLKLIADYLDLPDLFRFGAVCTTWCYATAEQRRERSRGLVQLPSLLLHRDTPSGAALGFFCTWQGRFLDLDLPGEFLGCGARCCGSSWGWLAMVIDADFDICLLNPVTRARVQLPSGIHFPFRPEVTYSGRWNPVLYLKKVVMSSDPSSRHCAVAAIGRSDRSYVLALCCPGRGDDRWSMIKDNHGREYQDVAFNGNRLCALDYRGVLTICRLAAAVRGVTKFAVVKLPDDVMSQLYLVGSCGELLVVESIDDPCARDSTSTTLRVFRLGRHGWEAVGSLGKRMLFVGEVSSDSVAAERGAVPGFRANCIYFTGRTVAGARRRAYGVFSMEAGCLFPVSDAEPCLLHRREPAWVMLPLP